MTDYSHRMCMSVIHGKSVLPAVALNEANEATVTMDKVLYEYLKINKYAMCTIGQWPYQTVLKRICIVIVFVPIVIAQPVLQGGGMIAAWMTGHIDMFLEGFSPFIISLMCLCKYGNFHYNHDQLKKLLDTVFDDFKFYSTSEAETECFRRNYAIARRVAMNYAFSLYVTMTPFMAVPLLLNIANTVGFYNATDRALMFPVEYFVDTERYFYPLLIHSYVATLCFITIVVGVDSMIILYVQHACGLCEILGLRLASFVEENSLDIELYPNNKNEDKSYQNARNCILLHQHIIRFTKTLEDANTTSFFFQLGLNMIGVTFTQFQAVVTLDNPDSSLRFASFTICLMSILLVASWPGQQLTDSTNRIFEYTTSGKWYQSSMRTRKLLTMILMRSIIPIRLTALKIYIFNLENYSAVVRTTFSYTMVLCSVQ